MKERREGMGKKGKKANNLKGTRDFGPEQVNRRDYMFGEIREIFARYGFQPIETPTMESLSTLTGKYGDEGDQLLFKVLNNGDYLRKANKDALAAGDSDALVASIAKRGLRYDLTVPFARFVVQHQNDLVFPFKRYQIQPVWRADSPQKGRYQEFFQCDVDVIGTESLLCETELIQIYDEVFARFGLKVVIRYNHRKILEGLADICGVSEKMIDLTVAIDKIDKIGWEGVKKELATRGFGEETYPKIQEVLATKNLEELRALFAETERGQEGIDELAMVQRYLEGFSLTNTVQFDPSLARGLSYYTGCIFEVIADTSAEGQEEIQMGSLGGGGRYDDLTGMFGLPNMPGVGISVGAERLYDLMEELSLFPTTLSSTSELLFVAMDEESHLFAFRALARLREAGINAEIYPSVAKLKKQMKYANARGFPYVAVVGERERESGQLAIKDMQKGEQTLRTVDEAIELLQAEK